MATSTVLDLPTDESLISRVCAGDQDALAEIYDRFASLVYSVALRVLREPTAAAQIMEQVFLHIWYNAKERSAHADSLYTWVVLLARNRALDCLRKGKSGGMRIMPVSAKPATVSHQRSFASAQARSAMNSLPLRQQQMLSLAFFGGQTPIQIAASTGASLSSVQLDLRNALFSFRAALTSQLAPSRC